MIRHLLTITALVVTLTACDGSTLVKTITTQLGAGGEHPCSGEFDFQTELNGVADDTRVTSSAASGSMIYTEQHWFADLEMIVYYAYEEESSWCNSWVEGGVNWVY